MTSAAIVSVKIIDIDESDTISPRHADTYSEFLREVNALKILSENKARNINHVIEALPVGPAMWLITEYCAGGSVATLVSKKGIICFLAAEADSHFRRKPRQHKAYLRNGSSQFSER